MLGRSGSGGGGSRVLGRRGRGGVGRGRRFPSDEMMDDAKERVVSSRTRSYMVEENEIWMNKPSAPYLWTLYQIAGYWRIPKRKTITAERIELRSFVGSLASKIQRFLSLQTCSIDTGLYHFCKARSCRSRHNDRLFLVGFSCGVGASSSRVKHS